MLGNLMAHNIFFYIYFAFRAIGKGSLVYTMQIGACTGLINSHLPIYKFQTFCFDINQLVMSISLRKCEICGFQET